MNKASLSVTLFCLILSACQSSNISSQWDCPLKSTGSCSSIAENDKKAMEKVKMDKKIKEMKKSDQMPKKLIGNGEADLQINQLNRASATQKLSHEFGSINNLRDNEEVGRIWFAPYIDEDDNLHESSVVYIVESPSKWAK